MKLIVQEDLKIRIFNPMFSFTKDSTPEKNGIVFKNLTKVVYRFPSDLWA